MGKVTKSRQELGWRLSGRFAELAQIQAEVLDRLLAKFLFREYLPVFEREAAGVALGWQLVRQPYNSGSYRPPLRMRQRANHWRLSPMKRRKTTASGYWPRGQRCAG